MGGSPSPAAFLPLCCWAAVGVCGLPWQMSRGKGEGPNVFLERGGTSAFLRRGGSCAHRSRAGSCSACLSLPTLASGAKPSKGVFTADLGALWRQQFGVTSSFRTCSFSPAPRDIGSAGSCLLSLFCLKPCWCPQGLSYPLEGTCSLVL